MSLAPIVLFAYNRPEHTRRTLQALSANIGASESSLYIYLDGVKENADPLETEKIKEVRSIVREEKWCAHVEIIESEVNSGLAASVVKGVTEVVNRHGKVIVLEDDLVSDIYFLKFMNDALRVYELNEEVISITGYIYPVKKPLPETFFLKGADCWGWAAWKRGWDIFEPDAKKLLGELEGKNLTLDFDFNGTYPYTDMLRDRIAGKNNSWAILWYVSAYLKNKLTLYPGHSLIQNIGIDGSGTHSGTTDRFHVDLKNEEITLKNLELKENTEARKIIEEYFRSFAEPAPKDSFKVKELLKTLTPAFVKNIYYKFRYPEKQPEKKYGWSGNYRSWEEVEKLCGGYSKDNILEKVKNSLLKVKKGEAAYERDSFAFETLEYSKELLKALKEISDVNKDELNILDFGGSLGSTYYQYKNLLEGIKIKWSVVDQPHFVKTGNELFSTEELKFFNTIEEAVEERQPKVLLLSSVLAYLPDPYKFLEETLKNKFEYVILYRTAFIEGNDDRLTLQTVPPSIYEASYPSWFLNEKTLVHTFTPAYELKHSFVGDIETETDLDGEKAYWRGMVFKLK